MKQIYTSILVAAFVGIMLCAAGCSADENPITPDKMEEIRKQEADQRGNFNPEMSRPPAEGQ